MIEIQRPNKIANGLLHVKLEIHSNDIQSRKIDYEKRLNDLYENSKLAEILKQTFDYLIFK